jgi:hypothetical protein
MNDSAAHKTAGGEAALWRARRDLLADAEARVKEMRQAVEQLRAALEAAGAALPPPADTDARLWPEAAAPPARGADQASTTTTPTNTWPRCSRPERPGAFQRPRGSSKRS